MSRDRRERGEHRQPAGGYGTRHPRVPSAGTGTVRGCRRARRRRSSPSSSSFGTQLDAVAQRRLGHRLHLVGRDELAGRPATPTPWPRAAASPRHEATRRATATATRGSPAPARRCRPCTAGSTRIASTCGSRPRPDRRRVATAPHAGGGEVVRVEPASWRASTSCSCSARRVADLQLEQEAVELRLGQRVGALVLDRVLRGDDDERVGQRVGPAPSTDTCRSSIASSSAACVFGGVRLISSASSRLVNTGPSRNRNVHSSSRRRSSGRSRRTA